MLKAFLPLFLLFSALGSTAQIAALPSRPKVDAALSQLYKNREEGQHVKVFVKLNDPTVQLEETTYFHVNSRFGRLVTADVVLEYLPQVIDQYNITRIEYESLNSPTMDSAKTHSNVWAVHKQWGDIDRSYRGKGVIVGIVDSGVDFSHKEFRAGSDNTKTRILSLWCQWDETGTKPDSFSYGSEYTQAQIEDEINGRTQEALPNTDYDPTNRGGQGHGTHVCGIAAGNNGVAPEAEIIGVSVLWETASIIDGVKYVLDKARAANKPCVINLSLGSQNNIHDGTGTAAEAYRAVANIRPEGTIICAAAGNSGSSLIHWGNFEVSEEKSTYFYGDPVELVFAIPDSLVNKLSFSITGFKGDYNYKENEFSNLEEFRTSNWVTPGSVISDSLETALFYKGGFIEASRIKMTTDPLEKDSRHHLFRVVIDDLADMEVRWDPYKTDGLDLYRINVRGEGVFNAWLLKVNSTYTGSFSRSTPDPEEIGAELPNNYTYPDDDYSVIAPALYHETLSIGASVNRTSYTDTKGKVHPAAWARKPAGSLATFSSKGPTVDGRIQPDIVAPGQNVFSAAPSYYDGWSPWVKDGKYTSSSGTSMSAPVVSGAVALYLEKFPKATLEDVRTDFLKNTKIDKHTASNGSLPNNHWGYGKLDVYKVLSGGLDYNLSITEAKEAVVGLYPNPANREIHVSGVYQKLSIFDLQGQSLGTYQNQSTISVGALPSGIYLLQVEAEGAIQNHRIAIAH